jgi:two-component system, response regulator
MSERQPLEILLVEDNLHDRELTLRALRKAKIENHIEVARDGAEALDMMFGEGRFASQSVNPPPRLVLLDLKLPKIDGLEVLQRIKSDPRTRRIPVVVLTSSQEQSDILKSYDLGVNSYIVKPVNVESFFAAVAQLGVYWLMYNQSPALEDI